MTIFGAAVCLAKYCPRAAWSVSSRQNAVQHMDMVRVFLVPIDIRPPTGFWSMGVTKPQYGPGIIGSGGPGPPIEQHHGRIATEKYEMHSKSPPRRELCYPAGFLTDSWGPNVVIRLASETRHKPAPPEAGANWASFLKPVATLGPQKSVENQAG